MTKVIIEFVKYIKSVQLGIAKLLFKIFKNRQISNKLQKITLNKVLHLVRLKKNNKKLAMCYYTSN